MVANSFPTRQQLPPTKYDDDLENRLVNFLDARHVPERSAVHFKVRGGKVVVRGPVHSARAKWLCLECCRHVAGVIKLVDEIVVELPSKKTPRRSVKPRATKRV